MNLRLAHDLRTERAAGSATAAGADEVARRRLAAGCMPFGKGRTAEVGSMGGGGARTDHREKGILYSLDWS